MKTAKEKAEELVLKFKQVPEDGTLAFYLSFELSKQFALIAVYEILKVIDIWSSFHQKEPLEITFWKEVRAEIEKL